MYICTYGLPEFDDYVEHHGVKGMHWGVRRYQNYDGSYTQRGLQRYRKSEANYNSAKSDYQNAKANYKSGRASKQDVKDAKNNLKVAKRKLDSSYDNLKRDNLADQGKKLYKSGKTITDNKARTAAIGTVTGVAATAAGLYFNHKGSSIATKYGTLKLSQVAPTAIAAGGAAVAGIFKLKDNYEAKRLRAYYAH